MDLTIKIPDSVNEEEKQKLIEAIHSITGGTRVDDEIYPNWKSPARADLAAELLEFDLAFEQMSQQEIRDEYGCFAVAQS